MSSQDSTNTEPTNTNKATNETQTKDKDKDNNNNNNNNNNNKDNKDKDAPQLSPNAPVFIPKWKREGQTLASAGQPQQQQPQQQQQQQHDDDDPHTTTPSPSIATPHTFSNDFGRSMSGGFNLSHVRSATRPPPGMTLGGLGHRSNTNSSSSNNNSSSSGVSPMRGPGIGPGLLGPRSASWREEASHSWRDGGGVGGNNGGLGGAAGSVLGGGGGGGGGGLSGSAAAAAAAALLGGDEGKSSKAITVEHRLIKPGSYSTWIRVLSADIGPAQLASVLSRCEESNNKGAIHVYLREKFINRQLVQQLKSQGYKFHHYVEDTQTFVYGKRPQDAEDGKELMNATAKELVGALVTSPDGESVLLMWEGGKWVFVTGYTMTREAVSDSLKREVRTQLKLELDKAFAPHLVGGWSRASAKFDCINEVFSCFVVRTTSTDLDLDEGVHARWFNIDELMQLLDMVDAQFKQMGVEPKLDSAIEHPPGNIFSHLALRWLKAFRTNRSWQTSVVAERHVFCCV